MNGWAPIPSSPAALPDLQPGEFEILLKGGQTAQLKFTALREVPTADVSRQVTHWRKLHTAGPALSALRAIDHRCGLWGAA
jgi:hypothetical protein